MDHESELTRYKRNEDLFAAEVDGEIVILSVEQGQYYGMGNVASRIWELLIEPRTLADISAVIASEYSVEQEECLKDIKLFLSVLQEKNFVVEV